MTSPYLDAPTRLLEQLHDELRDRLWTMRNVAPRRSGRAQRLHEHMMQKVVGRLAAVEAEIAERNKAQQAADLLRQHAPYREWCRDPNLCVGKGYCPRDPTCGD